VCKKLEDRGSNNPLLMDTFLAKDYEPLSKRMRKDKPLPAEIIGKNPTDKGKGTAQYVVVYPELVRDLISVGPPCR